MISGGPMLKSLVERLPHVKRVAGEIPGTMLATDAANLIRERVTAAGFREIKGHELIYDSLTEAEKFFEERENDAK